MTDKFTMPTLAGGMALLAVLYSPEALLAQDMVEGVFALPGATPAVTGQLQVTETGPLSRQIRLTHAGVESGEQITDYEVELTQQLHILATDAGLTHLIHEHADVIGDDGSFTAELEFPKPGLYHIYTDVVPVGLGQQVLRFDVTVGDGQPATDTSVPPAQDVTIGPLVSSDGPYTVTLDATQLQPGAETQVSLLVERDGAPAGDLEPYLGVSAHAVFIRAEDLAYVHAHAMGAGEDHGGHGGHGDHAGHDTEGVPAAGGHDHHAAPAAEAGHDHHGGHDEAGHDPAAAASVDPEMSLHVTAPAAGTYALWIEFIGDGEIRTVPFMIDIPEADHHAAH